MAIGVGTRLGPYEITAPIGSGGMGIVYRALDRRLSRDVAVKVLLPEFAGHADRRKRFELEARSASALNHPNIVAVYDIGEAEGTIYIAMELVEGATLRESLPSSPLPVRKVMDLAVQIADGLAKAHAAGIVHRDLKPENVMISRDGYVKILDFGLAKLVEESVEGGSELPTAAGSTRPGMVMGTVGYMSPEQASGKAVDFRSDQFSFGTLLYEMATGHRAFQRDTSAETLTAVIRDEPVPVAQRNERAPAPLRWLIERCLAKDPEERFASTRDLARDLAMLRHHLPEASGSGEVAMAGTPSEEDRFPGFQRLSFRRGTVLAARFAADGQTIVYGAAWEGEPFRLFSARRESPESSPLMLPAADLLSISPTGQLAVSLDRRWAGRFIWSGTLAEAPLLGGAPREILNDVQWADWSPDGNSLAVIRHVAGKHRIEFPIGNVLHETAGWFSHLRVSPKGDRVAFLDHPVHEDDSGAVTVVDRAGRTTVLSDGWITAYGLAWAPGGDEIWFTATKVGVARDVWAVSLPGQERLLARTPGELTIQDISRDGKVLLTNDNGKVGIVGVASGLNADRDLSLLDWSRVRDISPDGTFVLFDESGEGGGSRQGIYVRRTDGSPAIRLGDGQAGTFSPDGKSVTGVSIAAPKQAVIFPIRAGQRRPIDRHGVSVQSLRWLPDGAHLLIAGNEAGAGNRLYVQGIEGGEPRPITPEGIGMGFFPISPDGKLVVAQRVDGSYALFPLESGDPQSIPGLESDDRPIRWTPDGAGLFTFRRGELPCRVSRFDIASGTRERIRDLLPPDPAGIVEIVSVVMTPDGASHAYSYHRILSDLYLVDGLK